MSFLVKIGCQIIMPSCLGTTSAVCNKVRLPLPYDIRVTASLAVLTRSQVRSPLPVPDVASPDVAEADSEAATEIEHISDLLDMPRTITLVMSGSCLTSIS